MPRILVKRARPLTGAQIRERANKYRRTRTAVWVDPFPEVYGTKPEKMVYAELIRRGIPFQYVHQINTAIPDLEVNQWFKPDFLIPQHKIIIEVQGSYWHSKADKIESDSLRFALMTMAGYRVLPWWDFDIETRLHELFESVPELRHYTGRAVASPGRSSFANDSGGIKKMNQRRRKPWTRKPVKLKIKRTKKLAKTASRKIKGLF